MVAVVRQRVGGAPWPGRLDTVALALRALPIGHPVLALQSGDALPREIELTEQFGVSRAAVRKALRTLVFERLIYKLPSPRRGNFGQRIERPEGPKLDEEFHIAIAEASGNRVLASFMAAPHHEVGTGALLRHLLGGRPHHGAPAARHLRRHAGRGRRRGGGGDRGATDLPAPPPRQYMADALLRGRRGAELS